MPRNSTAAASATASPGGENLPVADFESALGELEALVGRMEEGELGLDESLGAFERGISLYRQCRSALDQAELKVRQLLDPLDPDSASPFEAEPS